MASDLAVLSPGTNQTSEVGEYEAVGVHAVGLAPSKPSQSRVCILQVRLCSAEVRNATHEPCGRCTTQRQRCGIQQARCEAPI